jgi:hypothetical protein
MSSTNYARNKSLDKKFGATDYTPPSTLYMGLSTTTIYVTGSGATEPAGSGYARVGIANTKSNWTYASSGCIVNSASIVFPEASGSWGTITDVGFWDSVTSGSLWYYTTINPLIVQTLTTVQFAGSSIAISET